MTLLMNSSKLLTRVRVTLSLKPRIRTKKQARIIRLAVEQAKQDKRTGYYSYVSHPDNYYLYARAYLTALNKLL